MRTRLLSAQLSIDAADIFGEAFRNLVGVMDGSELRKRRPSQFQAQHYSGHRHGHFDKLLSVCDIHRRISYLVVGLRGSLHWNLEDEVQGAWR